STRRRRKEQRLQTRGAKVVLRNERNGKASTVRRADELQTPALLTPAPRVLLAATVPAPPRRRKRSSRVPETPTGSYEGSSSFPLVRGVQGCAPLPSVDSEGEEGHRL